MVKSAPVDARDFNESLANARKSSGPNGKNLGALMAINENEKPQEYETEFGKVFPSSETLKGGECFHLEKSTPDKKSELIWIEDPRRTGEYVLEKIVSTLRLLVVHYPSNLCAVSDIS